MPEQEKQVKEKVTIIVKAGSVKDKPYKRKDGSDGMSYEFIAPDKDGKDMIVSTKDKRIKEYDGKQIEGSMEAKTYGPNAEGNYITYLNFTPNLPKTYQPKGKSEEELRIEINIAAMSHAKLTSGFDMNFAGAAKIADWIHTYQPKEYKEEK